VLFAAPLLLAAVDEGGREVPVDDAGGFDPRETRLEQSAEAAARRQLRRLVGWLEDNGHADAAASLREGLEETLTVLKLGLPPRLRRFFATTNAIENLIGTLRHVARNVKRWRNGTMIRRWVGLGVLRAAARFRRIKGHGDLAALATALRPAAAGERAA